MRTSDSRQYRRGQGSFDRVAMHFIENCVDTLPYPLALCNPHRHTGSTQSSIFIYLSEPAILEADSSYHRSTGAND